VTAAGEALQRTLEAEHAAVFLYSALGGATGHSSRLYDVLTEAHEAHRARRDELVTSLRRLGVTPTAAAPAYRLPDGVDTEGGIRAAALDVERACTTRYAELVAGTSGELRAAAVRALGDSAARQLALGARPSAFPGIEELSSPDM